MLRSIKRRLCKFFGVEKGLRAPILVVDEAIVAVDVGQPEPAPPPIVFDFLCDGIGVIGKNISALQEPKFVAAWDKTVQLSVEGWHGNVPDIRWRAHVACWAAKQALTLKGDFVECGAAVPRDLRPCRLQ
jgi:hypothetical protein